VEESVHRINITVLQSQYETLTQRGLNVSALIRQLLDQYLGGRTITLHVDPETQQLFELLRSEAGVQHQDLVDELKPALRRLLDKRLKHLESLRKKL
jgi:hypothetical protein